MPGSGNRKLEVLGRDLSLNPTNGDLCGMVASWDDLIVLSSWCKQSFLCLRFHFSEKFISFVLGNFGECPRRE
jgi:hypothetical protein